MIAPSDPDSALIERCDAFIRTNSEWDRQQRIVDALPHGEVRETAQEALDVLMDENVRTLDLIQQMPATSYAGRLARARACGEQWRHGLPEGFELLAAVLADSLTA